jgi:hypothetical protein
VRLINRDPAAAAVITDLNQFPLPQTHRADLTHPDVNYFFRKEMEGGGSLITRGLRRDQRQSEPRGGGYLLNSTHSHIHRPLASLKHFAELSAVVGNISIRAIGKKQPRAAVSLSN